MLPTKVLIRGHSKKTDRRVWCTFLLLHSALWTGYLHAVALCVWDRPCSFRTYGGCCSSASELTPQQTLRLHTHLLIQLKAEKKPNETVGLLLSLSRSFTTLGSGQRKFTFPRLYLKIRLIFFLPQKNIVCSY